MNKKIILVSSSINFYENFLYETINLLKKKYQISIVTNLNNRILEFDKVILKNINISRSINPLSDLIAIYKLIRYVKKFKPDVIISTSPKGGLITTIANFILQIPRIHILTGLIWSEKKLSLLNIISKLVDHLIIKYSLKIYLDSKSQIDFLLKNNLPQIKLSLISKGSIKGVDLTRFQKLKENIEKEKKKYQLNSEKLNILFLGRISHEKGIFTYLSVIKEIANENYLIKGIIVGRDEKNILKEYKEKNLDFDNYFQYFEYTNHPENFFRLADVVVIPSHREGFCQVAIEASACEVPVVGFDVIGLKDSVKQNESGFLVPFKNNKALKEKIKLLLDNKSLRINLGKKGRDFVKNNFNQDKVITHFINQLEQDLQKLL